MWLLRDSQTFLNYLEEAIHLESQLDFPDDAEIHRTAHRAPSPKPINTIPTLLSFFRFLSVENFASSVLTEKKYIIHK